jgi:putative Mg2+ transporter-C (MgtC) family protein
MPSIDLTLQLDLALRMLVAAALGAAVGFEREIHEHPAGMRTHLLVSLGSAVFTELSIYGFVTGPAPNGSLPTDTSRVAAQIVSGIGFLGAGAILKYGTSVRGLTTAASLWAVAAIGMAAGAGQWLIAAMATFIVVFSLWPLRALVKRFQRAGTHSVRIRLELGRLDALGDVSRLLADRRVEMAGVNSQRLGKGRYEVELELRLPSSVRAENIIAALTAIRDVELMGSATPED